MYINLHAHSRYSDGTCEIKDLIRFAKSRGVSYFSITDHDTFNGYTEIEKKDLEGINFISGVEISTKNHDYLHILGYGIDPGDSEFERKLSEFRERRILRVKEIIYRLQKQGIEITFEELNIRSFSTVGRPHIADVLVKKGYGKTRSEVFLKYLVEGKPAYVEPKGPEINEVIDLIKSSKGFAVLAHPGTVDGYFNIEEIVKKGFDGIEVFYPSHSSSKIKKYLEIALRYSLIVTAGTDYHGPGTDREEMDIYLYSSNNMKNIERLFNG